MDKIVDKSPDPLWEDLKDQLKSKISPLNYNNWFKPISAAKKMGEHFVISVPNKFIADWISDYYLDLLEKEVSGLANELLKIRFEIEAELPKAVGSGNGNGHGNGNGKETVPDPAPISIIPPIVRSQTISTLNPKYNFDSFVPGNGNQLAYAAAKAVAELPGGHYNPLFLYGGVGLGKTHLLNAIGLEISKKNPGFRIVYTSAEKFMNEFINNVRNNKMEDFRKKYRTCCDMLLVDDIQFFGGKESTQDEFFHTFNELHNTHRQLVLTGDKIPKDIRGIENRLLSRFEWGLLADVQPPDLESRIAILRKKAEADQIHLNNDVALFLASNVHSNVRELEGALIRLNAFASLTKSAISLDLAKEVLKNVFSAKPEGAPCTIETVQQVVAKYYQISIADLKSPRRMRGFAHPRQVAMYLCKKHLKVSFPEIGYKFGGKDHTTVIHACRKIETLLEKDANLQTDVAVLEQSLRH
ncbi:MAG: chromosomal replication initiator protein DnaA [Deltaproteobacteria bacterium]|nr:chromosomal replication initiator protein DnaA [Deltaproteobacteria bacterium]